MTKGNSYTTMCIFFSSFWGLCYGFVLLSSATGAGGIPNGKVLEPGNGWLYDLNTAVLLNEKTGDKGNVGFLVSGTVLVESIWGNANMERLLKFELQSPKLHIRSRKAPAPEGFVGHTSNLEDLKGFPFYVQWHRGKIEKILLHKNEPLSLANLKKGIASLFQFQLLDQEVEETDSSGRCTATYSSTDSNKFVKTKSACTNKDLPYFQHPDTLLGTKVESQRVGFYEMNEDSTYIKSIKFDELHSMSISAKEDIGNKVETQQSLILSKQTQAQVLPGDSLEEVVQQINIPFTQESLQVEREGSGVDEDATFQSVVNDYRNNLKSNVVGSVTSAKAIARLISVGRTSSKDDIAKTLGLKKNNPILHQLYDILGYVQTEASHEAVNKKLHFDDKKKEELSERYLWALSMSPKPNPKIISNLLSKHTKSSNLPDKVQETLLLSIAAMSHRYSKLLNYDKKVYHNVEESILHGLKNSKGEKRFIYLRALRNLRSSSTIPTLLEIASKKNEKEEVLAWKALRSFEPSQWTQEVLKRAITTFFQKDRMHDSSARTLSLDIILESQPSDEIVEKLVYFLISECKAYEVLQYMVQRFMMIAEKDEEFRLKINRIIKADARLNNYGVLAQRGLSTSLARSFLRGPSTNATLMTTQEIQNGIVKRGIVNVLLEKDDLSQEMFSLGIFSGGLSSFVSSDSAATDSEDSVTAGIELTVLGTQIRPFVFFNGQGELMGHVWSGTASEKTTAYQALALLHDHEEFVRLGPGFIAELDLKGATSFDLSGKIEISLWNRNAVSLVEKSAGIVIWGLIKVDTSFVKSQVEFSVSMEPKLNLQTDIEFYSGVNLCMRLSQPDFILRHNVFKIERIPGSKHRLRKAKYGKNVMPGKTYSLNKKNNEMCNAIFTK